MIESEVIAHTAVHLIVKENFYIEKISISTIDQRRQAKEIFKMNGIEVSLIDKIDFHSNEEDIYGYYTFKQGRPQKRLIVEAKGGNTYYNFYTMLGQFISQKKSPSSYYWFAFALPISWRDKVKNYLTINGEIKPVIHDIIERYTKSGQGLWFYFVKDNGEIVKETWKQALQK